MLVLVFGVLALEGNPQSFFYCLLKNSEAFLKEVSAHQFVHRYGHTRDLGGKLNIMNTIADGFGYKFPFGRALCAWAITDPKPGRRAPGEALAFSGFRVRVALDGDEPLAEDAQLDLARKGFEGTFGHFHAFRVAGVTGVCARSAREVPRKATTAPKKAQPSQAPTRAARSGRSHVSSPVREQQVRAHVSGARHATRGTGRIGEDHAMCAR